MNAAPMSETNNQINKAVLDVMNDKILLIEVMNQVRTLVPDSKRLDNVKAAPSMLYTFILS